MNCSDALDLLLEADLPELDGEGDSELASHITSCPNCSASAKRILTEQLNLADSLSRARPRTPVNRTLELAQSDARRRQLRRRMWQAMLPAAAAAGIVGILVGRNGGNGPLERFWQSDVPRSVIGLDLETPTDKNVAVFEVADRPDIIVVWFYENGD